MTRKAMFSQWLGLAAIPFVLASYVSTSQAQDASAGSSVTPLATHSIFTTVPIPNLQNTLLLALSADSENDIWAVGDISLHFDGKKWTNVPLVEPPPGGVFMQGVAAVSPTDAWAVGSVLVTEPPVATNPNETFHFLQVIERFDGTKWKLVPSPQFRSGSELNAVLAISPDDIYAVGDSNSDAQLPSLLVEHYDGATWRVVPTPKLPKGQTASLRQIAASSPTDIWLAGDSSLISGVGGPPILLHFDGERFTNVPFLPGQGAIIGGIAAIDSNDAWITGSLGASTLAAHWDGHHWTRVHTPTPNGGPGTNSGSLGAISVVSADDIWATGSTHNSPREGTSDAILYAEHWNGKIWTVLPITPELPELGEVGAVQLTGIVAFPSGSAFAGGFENFNSVIFHTTQGN